MEADWPGAADIAFLHRPIAEINETLPQQPCRVQGKALVVRAEHTGTDRSAPPVAGHRHQHRRTVSSLSGPSQSESRARAMIRKAQAPHHVHVDPCRFHPSGLVENWCDPSSTHCSDPPSIRPFSIHGNVHFGTTPLMMMHLRIPASFSVHLSFLVDREGERVRLLGNRSYDSYSCMH
jgi:hypothetical protein